jgi:6,7-dimethyl-8-ribityllumazine synthase
MAKRRFHHFIMLSSISVHTCWNTEYVELLLQKAIHVFEKKQVTFDIIPVPGSFELPFMCKRAALSNRFDAVLAIGVLIKGETLHFEYISESVSHGLMNVGLETGIPVIFGVLTCLNEEQVRKRCGLDGGHNHGEDWALTAIEMVHTAKSDLLQPVVGADEF